MTHGFQDHMRVAPTTRLRFCWRLEGVEEIAAACAASGFGLGRRGWAGVGAARGRRKIRRDHSVPTTADPTAQMVVEEVLEPDRNLFSSQTRTPTGPVNPARRYRGDARAEFWNSTSKVRLNRVQRSLP